MTFSIHRLRQQGFFAWGLPAAVLFSMVMTPAVHASGMQLEAGVVVVDTKKGEGTITLKNTESKPMLLYTSVENTPQDPQDLLVVTPPVVRVDPGETQMVRFMLKNTGAPVTTERLKRAIFEGIPASDKKGDKLQITLRQNIPLIIHPSALAANPQPWTLLQWSTAGSNQIKVTNTGAYVVRMSPSFTVLPQKAHGQLPRTYILPGESLTVPVKGTLGGAGQKVNISPANLYGYINSDYQADLK